MKVWVSPRAARLNADDEIDFVVLAECAAIHDDGYAHQFIYIAKYDGEDVYIVTESEL